jgi:Fur family ferric uptake transcriptional regulator
MTPERQARWADHARATLQQAGHRAGGARSAVVELLADESCCLGAQEIFERLRSGGRRVGIASVYRALDQLAALGLVQRVDVGGGIARYEAAHPDGGHHHHVVCDDCGRVAAFADERLEAALETLGGALDFEIGGHDVVLHGACGDCRR